MAWRHQMILGGCWSSRNKLGVIPQLFECLGCYANMQSVYYRYTCIRLENMYMAIMTHLKMIITHYNNTVPTQIFLYKKHMLRSLHPIRPTSKNDPFRMDLVGLQVRHLHTSSSWLLTDAATGRIGISFSHLSHIISSPWIWKGVSATLPSGRYTLSYPRWR